jgi:hypothetical protein
MHAPVASQSDAPHTPPPKHDPAQQWVPPVAFGPQRLLWHAFASPLQAAPGPRLGLHVPVGPGFVQKLPSRQSPSDVQAVRQLIVWKEQANPPGQGPYVPSMQSPSPSQTSPGLKAPSLQSGVPPQTTFGAARAQKPAALHVPSFPHGAVARSTGHWPGGAGAPPLT